MTAGIRGKQALLDAAIDYVAANGIRDRSLREIAAGLGSSHRMLIYHFGSKEGLLVEIVRTMERRQRAVLDELSRQRHDSPTEVARVFWERVTDPALWPHERLFFEIYGRALHGDPAVRPVLDGIVETWIEPLAHALHQAGVDPAQARAHARLGLAVARGLLLDLLATGDRAAVDDAMGMYIAMYETTMPTDPAAST
ncbi:TetR/AcrR family transcriptional regulator [Phytoactinopolyspora halotolerans]|uniref:TetR/AcrR family transcriptional regulator n=1 Tax=Phytoactinopolyspora halotolerans TaxID=1981512 RepID=UPI001C205C34|nr:TetR/AcrR family transcriptional regulator [Phytoactinopolyspora halotolerans]